MRRLPALAVVPLLGLAACSDEDGPVAPGPSEDVQLALTGFGPFAEGDGVFELWISFAQGRVAPGLRHSTAASAGRFRVGGSGVLVGTDGNPATFALDPASDAVPLADDGSVAWQLAVDAFVTIEAADDPDPDAPNLPGIVGGGFLNGQAVLGIGHADALATDFSAATGSFHLATPTTAASSDEIEGVWFATTDGGSPSLTLPAPPSGWVYEAWLSLGFFGNVSLGRFTSASGADFDGPGSAAGPLPGYPFPGGDFPLGTTGVDFRPGNVLVTLEPPGNVDGTTRRSFLTILLASLEATQAAGAPVPMTNVAASPGGTVTIPFQP